MATRNPHSYHLFLFPFQWDYLPAGKRKKDCDFESRSKLERCEASLKRNDRWKHNPYIIGEETNIASDYNEFTFFYDFVRKTIFDYNEQHDKNERLQFFSYKTTKGSYTIHIKTGETSNKVFKLGIRDISLHLFNTGVGILTFNLENFDYPQADDILLINEYGRRIYPQFLGENLINETKWAFLADKIEVNFGEDQPNIVEDFEHYNKGDNLKTSWFRLPAHIRYLFDGTTFTEEDKTYTERILISNVMDDRMFTLCWYGNNEMADQLGSNPELGIAPYETSKWWYAFTMCDKDSKWPSVANLKELKRYIDKHTYKRWSDFGTLYGLSRETFMVISKNIETLNTDHAPPLYDHLRTMYFQIVVLCLVCRASMLRFSGEVSRLTDLAHHHLGEKHFLNPIEKLYENYIEFLNKIHFREVTAQVQGIELYNMLYEHMNLKEQISDLDSELDELHRFVNMRREKQRNDNAQMLNYLAAFFLPMTVIAGFLGANINGWSFQGITPVPHMLFWEMVGISIGFSAFVFIFVFLIGLSKKRK